MTETYDPWETGKLLAQPAFERGERVTTDQRQAMTHWSMFGSVGYPLCKRGRKWTVDHCATSAPLFATKRAAADFWDCQISKWNTLDMLERQAVQP